MDDVDIGGPEFIFWMAMVWVVYLIAILVMLAVAYGFVRVVLTTWERVSPSAPKGSSRPHARSSRTPRSSGGTTSTDTIVGIARPVELIEVRAASDVSVAQRRSCAGRAWWR